MRKARKCKLMEGGIEHMCIVSQRKASLITSIALAARLVRQLTNMKKDAMMRRSTGGN